MDGNVNLQDTLTLEDQLEKQKIEEKKELKKLRSTANYIGLAMFMFLVLSAIIMSIPELLKRYDVYNTSVYSREFLYLKPEVYFLIYGTAFMVSLFVPFFFATKLCRASLSETIRFEKVDKNCIIPYAGVGLIVFALMNYFVELLTYILNYNGIYPKRSQVPYDNSPLSIILYVIAISVLPALFEEFAFRGVILGLLRKYGDAFAVVTSSILFGLMHANIYQIPFAFVGGLYFGYLVIKTNSLLPGIIMHFINNLSCSMVTIISKNSGISDEVLSHAPNAIFIIVGIISLIYLLKRKGKDAFRVSNYASPIGLAKRTRAFYLSPLIVIFIIFIVMAVGISCA